MARSVPPNLISENSVVRAAEMIATEHGRLDILVNNVGIFDMADPQQSVARRGPLDDEDQFARRARDDADNATAAARRAGGPDRERS